MAQKDCNTICNLLSGLNRIKVMAGIILAAVALTSCSYRDSIDIEMSEVASETDISESFEEIGIKISKEHCEKVEISMEEAISIGMNEALKYYSDLQLTEVHSYDNDYDINYVSVLISDGKIDVVEHFDNNVNNGLLDLSEINLTAKEAVKMAKEMGMRGGDPLNNKDWVSGYNFKMSYASLVDSPDDIRIFLEVIGISPNGNFAHIDFDAVTGKVILAEEKVEYNNGETEWVEFE